MSLTIKRNRYCIMGICPGTFISRKMMISTFSRFLFSQPAHVCTNYEFSVNSDDSFCAEFVCAEQKSQSYFSSIELARQALLIYTLIALSATYPPV